MQTGTIFLGILVLCVVAVMLVVLYGLYQENQYRKEIFKQFGHSHKDALLGDPVTQVRDAQSDTLNFNLKSASTGNGEQTKFNQDREETNVLRGGEHSEVKIKNSSSSESTDVPLFEEHRNAVSMSSGFDGKEVKVQDPIQDSLNLEGEKDKYTYENRFSYAKDSIVSKIEKIFPKKSRESYLAITMDELEELELPWFNKCFDYMAYVILDEPRELNVLPRLSSKHRFKIAACNLDDQFQLAEPIPGVKYKAYIIGLQVISRSGLAGQNDLALFGKNVRDFAKSLGGSCRLTDIATFYEVARPMDQLCARVDQIIGLHLVSRNKISGIDLRATLEKNSFTLFHDGAFYYPNYEEELFKVVNMDETPFTASLLASQSFKGFSILFDITRVPPGQKNFDKFMGLAVKLANELGLDLVDDQLEELSTEWLRNIGDYVLERQKEMETVGIIPGEDLAKRLFS